MKVLVLELCNRGGSLGALVGVEEIQKSLMPEGRAIARETVALSIIDQITPNVRGAKSTRLAVSLLMCSALVSVGAGPAQAESLNEALVAAYTSNPTLMAERAGLRATGESVWQARAGWMPTVSLQGAIGTQESTNKTSDVVIKADPKSGAAVISQPIFRGGATYYGTRSAKAQTRAAEANLRSVEQQILLDAVTAYYDVLRDISVVELSGNNVQVLERQLQAAQDRFRVGEITRTDVAQAEARLSGSRSRLTQSEATLTASRSAYERVIGHMPIDMGEIGSLPEIAVLPKSEEEAISTALQSNPTLQSVRDREEASREGVKATRGALLPQVSLQGSYNYGEDQQGFDIERETTSITGQVVVPLYQGGAAWSRLRQAKQVNSQNRIQIAETQRRVKEGVINAWEGLRSTQATIVSSQQQVRANEIAFDGVQQEAQVGSRTTLDVLDAEQELLDARVTLVGARRNEMVAAYALLSAIGRLSVGDLGLAMAVEEPEDAAEEATD